MEGHTSRITVISFSTDGKLFASASGDRSVPPEVRVWSSITGAMQQTLHGHTSQVSVLAFSPDDQVLASGCDDAIKIWKVATGALLQTFVYPSQVSNKALIVHELVFSPNGRLLMSRFSDDECFSIIMDLIWNTATGKLLQADEGLNEVTALRPVNLGPGQLLVEAIGNKVYLSDASSDTVLQTFEGVAQTCSLAISSDCQLLAFLSVNRTIDVWKTATGALWRTLHFTRKRSDMNLKFSPNNKFIILRSSQRELITSRPIVLSDFYKVIIWIWDIATGALQQTISYNSSSSSGRSNERFSPDCRRLATWSPVRIWDTATGALLQTLEAGSNLRPPLAFSPDGRLLVSRSVDSRLQLWDIATPFSEQDVERRFSEYIDLLEVSSNGRFLASSTFDSQIQLWDATAGTLLRTFETNQVVNVVVFSPDGRILAGGCTDAIWLWDTFTYSLQRIISSLEDIMAWSISSYGRTLPSAEGGRSVPRLNFGDVSTGALKRTKTPFTPIKALAFSPDSRLLASVSADLELRLSDVADTCSHTEPGKASSNSVKASGSMESHVLKNLRKWRLDWRLRSHRTSLAFSADSRLLACLIEDDISVWDTGTKSLRLADSAPSGVVSLAFSEDGSLLKTNMGSFKIQSSDEYPLPLFPPPSSSFSAAPDQIYVHQSEWIRYGKHAIWLPLEYRASQLWKVTGKSLAMGIESGGILIMSFV